MGKRKFNEEGSINYYDISKQIIDYWNSNKIFEKSINTRPKNKIFPFMKDHHLLMECLVYIMLWQELLKIFFADIKH